MTRRRLLAVFPVILLLVQTRLTAQTSNTSFDFSAVEATAQKEMHDTQTPGAAIAVVLGDRVIYSRGFGVANVETNEPLRPEMLFRLGSTTKMFTATALVGLAEKGAIDLNRPIGGYVKGLNGKIAQVTAHQLLSHTAGFLDEAPMFGSSDESALEKEVRSWTESRFFTEPSKIYSYSNPGFWLAGFLVESLSGKPYADQMDGGLFKPLGMTRTTLRPLLAMTYPLALGHDETPQGPKVVRPAANNTASWPAGSIFSNVSDLSRFVVAFVNGGRLDNTQVLSPTLITTLRTPRVKIPGSEAQYGYGLEIVRSRGVEIVRHGGSRSGYGSMILMVPERHFGVVVLANRTGTGMSRTVNKAMETVLSLEPAKPTPSRPATTFGAAEIHDYIGTYSQGARTMEIVGRDGKIVLKQQTRESALVKVGDAEIEVPDQAHFVVIRGADGAVEYLHGGGRSWRKVR